MILLTWLLGWLSPTVAQTPPPPEPMSAAFYQVVLDETKAQLAAEGSIKERTILQNTKIEVLPDGLGWTAGFRAVADEGLKVVATQGFMFRLQSFTDFVTISSRLGLPTAVEQGMHCFVHQFAYDDKLSDCPLSPADTFGMSDAAMQRLLADPNLQGQMIGAFQLAVGFALAHELGHHVLDLYDHPALTNEQRVDRETKVDRWAVEAAARAGWPALGMAYLASYHMLADPDRIHPRTGATAQGHPQPALRMSTTICPAAEQDRIVGQLASNPGLEVDPATYRQQLKGLCAEFDREARRLREEDDEAHLKREAAEDPDAAYRLAALLLGPEWHRRDVDEGMTHLKRAAELGDGPAQFLLGQNLSAGQGTPRGPEEGYYWMLVAEDAGLLHARAYLDAGRRAGADKEPAFQRAICMADRADEIVTALLAGSQRACERDCSDWQGTTPQACVRSKCTGWTVRSGAFYAAFRAGRLNYETLLGRCPPRR